MRLTVEQQFKKIFELKEVGASIAEKSFRNLTIKCLDSQSRSNEAIHYFTVAHKFKQIDCKNVFGLALNQQKNEIAPTRFLSLQVNYLVLTDSLGKLIKDIRNINSHYIHQFDLMNLDNTRSSLNNYKLRNFILESFELSCLFSYFEEKGISEFEYFSNDEKSEAKEKLFINFLRDKFYPNDEKQKEDRESFINLTKKQALEKILYINVESQFEWNLFGSYPIFVIKKGTYLSAMGMLFVLSLFLYKHEAEQLISKIRGFKKNQEIDSRSKRNIFTFYAKKFRSQDINNEEKSLVNFRDIIQYLNHYPKAWNIYFEKGHTSSEMIKEIVDTVVELEIERLFFKYLKVENDYKRFLIYSKYQYFTSLYSKKTLEKSYIEAKFTEEEVDEFELILTESPELKNARITLENLKGAKKQDLYKIRKQEKQIAVLTNSPNTQLEKLKDRIANQQLITSYGRNQDRFIPFTLRFLADENYFGANTKFKMYQFFTIEEQESFLSNFKTIKTKKEVDNLKYHNGRLVHYITYTDHKLRYPEWEYPFVEQNNAVYIQFDQDDYIITLQRSLLIYFLEHALYILKEDNIKEAGKELINNYLTKQRNDYTEGYNLLTKNRTISISEKNTYSKLFSRKLLHQYSPAQQNQISDFSKFQKTFKDVMEQESRYELLHSNAKKLGLEMEFLKRNKGKQFKLRFIKKAWNIMYFKDIYEQRVFASKEHHKAFHITRDEYNDFCRWIYAADEYPSYKENLKALFKQKQFLNNKEFELLFDEGKGLNDWYTSTKTLFKQWIKENTDKSKKISSTVQSYDAKLMTKNIFINLSHFIPFLIEERIIVKDSKNKITFQGSDNTKFLIEGYYHKFELNFEQQKKSGLLYKKLYKNIIEDVLLYELAFKYLKYSKDIIETPKNHIKEILNQEIEFEIYQKDGKKSMYNLIVPFNKLVNYSEILTHKLQQIKNNSRSEPFLVNIKKYVLSTQHKDLKEIRERMKTSVITYDDLYKINNHLMSTALLFTKINMKLEAYYIFKNSTPITKPEGYIELSEIKGLNSFYTNFNLDRNRAFHFGVPDNSYIKKCKQIELEFYKKEAVIIHKYIEHCENNQLLSDAYSTNFNSLKIILSNFKEVNHNAFYDIKINDPRNRKLNAQKKYFDYVKDQINNYSLELRKQ